MKKVIAIMLAALMLLAMTACNGGGENGDDVQEITINNNQGDAGNQEQGGSNEEEGVFAFTYEGVEYVPGEAFDASKLPEPMSSYTVPSCAVQGEDVVYNYGTFELTAYDLGEGEHVYSVYFLDPNLTTAEGLALGDSLDKVVELYGSDYVQEGSSYTYIKGSTMLIILLDGQNVMSIEYRLNNG